MTLAFSIHSIIAIIGLAFNLQPAHDSFGKSFSKETKAIISVDTKNLLTGIPASLGKNSNELIIENTSNRIRFFYNTKSYNQISVGSRKSGNQNVDQIIIGPAPGGYIITIEFEQIGTNHQEACPQTYKEQYGYTDYQMIVPNTREYQILLFYSYEQKHVPSEIPFVSLTPPTEHKERLVAIYDFIRMIAIQ